MTGVEPAVNVPPATVTMPGETVPLPVVNDHTELLVVPLRLLAFTFQ